MPMGGSRPALSVSPLAVALVELVHLPSGGGRVAQVYGLHLFGLDDHHAEVLSRHWVFKILDLRSGGEVLVIVRLVHRLAGRWVLE